MLFLKITCHLITLIITRLINSVFLRVAQEWPTVTLQFDKEIHLCSCHCFMKAHGAGSYRRISLCFQSQCAGKFYTMGSKALSFLFTRFKLGEVNTTDWFREVSPSTYFNHQPVNCLRNILWMFHFMPVYQTLTLLLWMWKVFNWKCFYCVKSFWPGFYNFFFIANTKPTTSTTKTSQIIDSVFIEHCEGEKRRLLLPEVWW